MGFESDSNTNLWTVFSFAYSEFLLVFATECSLANPQNIQDVYLGVYSSRLVRRRMLSETTETDQMRTPYTNGKNRKTEEKARDFTVL